MSALDSSSSSSPPRFSDSAVVDPADDDDAAIIAVPTGGVEGSAVNVGEITEPYPMDREVGESGGMLSNAPWVRSMLTSAPWAKSRGHDLAAGSTEVRDSTVAIVSHTGLFVCLYMILRSTVL